MSSLFSLIPTSRSTLQEMEEIMNLYKTKNKNQETITQVTLTYSSNDSFNQDTQSKTNLGPEVDSFVASSPGNVFETGRFKNLNEIENKKGKNLNYPIDVRNLFLKERNENDVETQQKIMKLEIVLTKITEQLNKAEQTIDLKNKELFSLKELNKKKEQEIDLWKNKYLQMESNKSNQGRTLEEDKTAKLEITNTFLVKKNNELEEKCGLLEFEIEKLNETLKMKEVEQNELLQWKEKCIEIENMNEEIIKSNVEARLREISGGKQNFEAQLNQYKNTIQTYEDEIKVLCKEIVRLRQFNEEDCFISPTKEKDSNGNSLEKLKQGAKAKRNKNTIWALLKATNGDEALSENESEEEFRPDIIDEVSEKDEISSLGTNMQTLTYLSSRKQTKVEREESHREEIKELQQKIKEYEEMIRNFSEKHKETEREKRAREEVEKQAREFKSNWIDCEKVIIEMKRKLELSEKELLDIGDRNKELTAKLDFEKKRMKELEEKLNLKIEEEIDAKYKEKVLKEDKERLVSHINEYKMKLSNLEKEYNQMKKEIEEKNLLMESHKKEVERLQCQIDKKEKNGKDLQELESQMTEEKKKYEEIIEKTSKSRQEFEDRLYIVARENVSQQNKIKILEDEISSNQSKITGLEKENNRLQDRIKELATSKMKEFIALSKDYSEKLTAKEAIIEETKAKWLKSYNEMEQIAHALESKKNSMQEQVNQMRGIVDAKNEELEHLTNMSRAQEMENRYLVEELKNLRSKGTRSENYGSQRSTKDEQSLQWIKEQDLARKRRSVSVYNFDFQKKEINLEKEYGPGQSTLK